MGYELTTCRKVSHETCKEQSWRQRQWERGGRYWRNCIHCAGQAAKKKSNCCVVMVVHFEDLLDVSEFWRKKIENVTSSTVARHVRFVGFTTIVLSSFLSTWGHARWCIFLYIPLVSSSMARLTTPKRSQRIANKRVYFPECTTGWTPRIPILETGIPLPDQTQPSF